MYHRKFEPLYSDRTAGATTALSLWNKSRSTGEEPFCLAVSGEKIATLCDCCTQYIQWKEVHRSEAKELQRLADIPCYYRVYVDEQVQVGPNSYVGTIRALHMAPEGACNGRAHSIGDHPYVCTACEALQHGKSSQLLHKLQRAAKLKHTRSQNNRACFQGVQHKYVSNEHLQSALSERTYTVKNRSKALVLAEKKTLRDSWCENETARPFVEQLVKLFADK